MGLYSGGPIIGRIFASEIWEDYFREVLFLFFIYLFYYNCFLGRGAYYRNFTVGTLKMFTPPTPLTSTETQGRESELGENFTSEIGTYDLLCNV